jgi:hypothetical protein
LGLSIDSSGFFVAQIHQLSQILISNGIPDSFFILSSGGHPDLLLYSYDRMHWLRRRIPVSFELNGIQKGWRPELHAKLLPIIQSDLAHDTWRVWIISS